MPASKIYRNIPGFEYGYIRSPKEMVGRMEPFSPCWWVQELSNGYSAYYNTKAEVMDHIKDVQNICSDDD